MTKIIFSPKLPLETDLNDNFIYNTETLQYLKQNLKMLIMTNPGEKISDPEFGIGVLKYIFELQNGILPEMYNKNEKNQLQDVSGELFSKIQTQSKKYIPGILIEDVIITGEEKEINILIKYNYKEYISDSLLLSVGQ